MNNHTLNLVKHIPEPFTCLSALLVTILLSIWIVLLVGKVIIIHYNRRVEVGWLSRLAYLNEIKKIILFLTILTFATFSAMFHTAQEFNLLPANFTNCSEGYSENTHIYSGLSHVCILMSISFINVTTMFFQNLYSKVKDTRLVKFLIVSNILLKLPLLLTIVSLFDNIWVQLFVIIWIYMEYVWLIRSEILLYQTIKVNIYDLENSSVKVQKHFQEKKSNNAMVYTSLFIGCSFLLISLPINWVNIYIEVATRCPDKGFPLEAFLSGLHTHNIPKILRLTVDILNIPLILMEFALICLTIFWMIKKLVKQIQEERKRRDSLLNESLIQH